MDENEQQARYRAGLERELESIRRRREQAENTLRKYDEREQNVLDELEKLAVSKKPARKPKSS